MNPNLKNLFRNVYKHIWGVVTGAAVSTVPVMLFFWQGGGDN